MELTIWLSGDAAERKLKVPGFAVTTHSGADVQAPGDGSTGPSSSCCLNIAADLAVRELPVRRRRTVRSGAHTRRLRPGSVPVQEAGR